MNQLMRALVVVVLWFAFNGCYRSASPSTNETHAESSFVEPPSNPQTRSDLPCAEVSGAAEQTVDERSEVAGEPADVVEAQAPAWQPTNTAGVVASPPVATWLESGVPVTPILPDGHSRWHACRISHRGLTCLVDGARDLPDDNSLTPCRLVREIELASQYPGPESVWACGDHLMSGCPDEYAMVVLITRGDDPSDPWANLGAFATTDDMSCGSSISFRGRSMVLRGGGEDVEYTVTYRWQNGEFQRVNVRLRDGAHARR